MNKLSKNINATWIKKATVLTLLVGAITACAERRTETTEVVVTPTPQQTTVVTPAPQPTSTVVVTPTPQPTTTVVVTPTPQPTSTVAVVTEPITDVVVINQAPNKQALANKQVQFTDVKVQSVVGDRAFWVGNNNNQRLFVVLDASLDAGSAEKQVVVKPGQTVDLSGVLQPAPTVEAAQKQFKGLSANEAQSLRDQAVYLQARNINIQ